MPIQVDVDRRRRDIAEATFRVAADLGLPGVTIRSVAGELGASTTVITNYLPTRAALLVNAVDHLGEEWIRELEKIRSDGGPDVVGRALVASVDWDASEQLRCQFWVDLLTAPGRGPEVDERLRDTARRVRAVFADLAADKGHPDPESAADTLFLFAQGVFVSIVEDPGEWSARRSVKAGQTLVAALFQENA